MATQDRTEGLRMRLYLVRHGETELNKEFRFIGRTDVGLSESGRLQAKKVAERLSEKKIKAVYSSDMLRAVQTAEIITEPLGLNAKLLEGLREIDFGNWEGLTYYEIEEMDGDHLTAWIEDPININIPKGETWEHFESRVLKSMSLIIKEEKDGEVVIVSHGGPIKLLVSHYYGRDPEFFNSFWPSPGTVSVVEITGDKAQILVLNDKVFAPDGS